MSRRIDSTSIGVHLVPGRAGWTTTPCPYAGLIKMALVLPALLEHRRGRGVRIPCRYQQSTRNCGSNLIGLCSGTGTMG